MDLVNGNTFVKPRMSVSSNTRKTSRITSRNPPAGSVSIWRQGRCLLGQRGHTAFDVGGIDAARNEPGAHFCLVEQGRQAIPIRALRGGVARNHPGLSWERHANAAEREHEHRNDEATKRERCYLPVWF